MCAKGVLRDTGVKVLGGQIAAAGDEHELIRRKDQMQRNRIMQTRSCIPKTRAARAPSLRTGSPQWPRLTAARRSMFVFLGREIRPQGSKALRSACRAHVRDDMPLTGRTSHAVDAITQARVDRLVAARSPRRRTDWPYLKRVLDIPNFLRNRGLNPQRHRRHRLDRLQDQWIDAGVYLL